MKVKISKLPKDRMVTIVVSARVTSEGPGETLDTWAGDQSVSDYLDRRRAGRLTRNKGVYKSKPRYFSSVVPATQH